MKKYCEHASRVYAKTHHPYRPFYSRNLERVLYPHRPHITGDAFIPWRTFRRLTRSFRLDRW